MHDLKTRLEVSRISNRIYNQNTPQGEALLDIARYLTANLIRSRQFAILFLLLLNHVRLFVLSRLHYWGERDFYSEIRLWNNLLGLITIDKQWMVQYQLDYPQDIDRFIDLLKETFCIDNPKVLEIGSGPVSKLREGTDDFELYCLDPLASEYTRLHKIVKMKASFKFIQGTCEELSQILKGELFHLVYASNSLDHTEDPALCLKGMSNVLKPYGILYIESHEREGSHLAWYGLHQYDLIPSSSDLYLGTKDGNVRNITTKLTLKQIYSKRKPEERWFSIAWQKLPDKPKKQNKDSVILD